MSPQDTSATKDPGFIGGLPVTFPGTAALSGERAALAKEIAAALMSGNTAGAVILGELGIGKSVMLQHTSTALADHAYVVQLRGSAFGSRVRYGALSFLLAELDENSLDRPVLILEGLIELLQERAAGKPVILAIDNADQLDESSVMLIGQLVSSQTVLILASCREVAGSVHEFAQMCRANAMERFELTPLSAEDTGLLLREILGQPISRLAISTLYRHGQGNPRWLSLLCHDYVQCGKLELHQGVWVITDHHFQMQSTTRDAICETVAHLPSSQRDLINLIGAAGEVPLAALQQYCDPTDLDALQEQSLVTIGSDRALTVRLTCNLLREAVRSGMLTSRRQTLVQQLRAAAPVQAVAAHPHTHSTDDGGSRQRGEARVAGALAAAREGRYADVLLQLREHTTPELDVLHPEYRTLAVALVAEALAMTGRIDDSLALAESTEAIVDSQQHPVADQAAQCLANMRLAAGVWTTTPNSRHASKHPIADSTWCELADGLLLAFAGNPQEALTMLMPALRQCEASNLAGLGALASAAVDYCQAVLGQGSRLSSSFLWPDAAEVGKSSWLVRRLTLHFTILTGAYTKSRGQAAEELLALSRKDHALGVSAFELLSLSSALRLGEARAIEPLLTVSARCQGDFARLCELYAKGMDNFDLQLMLQAMEEARSLDYRSFSQDAAETALQFAAETRRRSDSRLAHRRVDATLTDLREHGRRESILNSLTAREAEVVRMIAEGKSNKEIAAHLDVSVRTVEGHLYQVYSKLHVRDREELARLLAADQGRIT